MDWRSFRNILPILLIALACFPAVYSAEEDEEETYAYYEAEFGFENPMIFIGDPMDINCVVVVEKEILTEDQMRNVTIKYKKDDVLLPDYWSLSQSGVDIKEEFGVESLFPFNFTILKTNESHRGNYRCDFSYHYNETFWIYGKGEFFGRVKESPSPLWPGVAFGGEILFLAFILTIYECTRNKDELEQEEDDADH